MVFAMISETVGKYMLPATPLGLKYIFLIIADTMMIFQDPTLFPSQNNLARSKVVRMWNASTCLHRRCQEDVQEGTIMETFKKPKNTLS